MAATGVDVKMGVSGVTQFKAGMKESQAAVKNLSQQLKLNEQQLKLNWDAEKYRQALNRMAQARQGSFNGGYRTTSGASDCDFCSMCSTLWCADTCCECMGGDICRCM